MTGPTAVRVVQWLALKINACLRPFGLVLWVTYDIDVDERGLPTNIRRIVGWEITKRPDLGALLRQAQRGQKLRDGAE